MSKKSRKSSNRMVINILAIVVLAVACIAISVFIIFKIFPGSRSFSGTWVNNNSMVTFKVSRKGEAVYYREYGTGYIATAYKGVIKNGKFVITGQYKYNDNREEDPNSPGEYTEPEKFYNIQDVIYESSTRELTVTKKDNSNLTLGNDSTVLTKQK